jgi:dTDP-glucose 4,6-dehydratase
MFYPNYINPKIFTTSYLLAEINIFLFQDQTRFLQGENMKNVLITGGAGFIGSNFIHYLLSKEKDINVVNLDALTYAGSLENLKTISLPEKHLFIKGNICDKDLVRQILRNHQIDTIVHFAAESHVDRSIQGPTEFIQTNIFGTFTLLECARQVWMDECLIPAKGCRFHHISTDEVFGSLGKDDKPFREKTPYSPNSPYSASKASSDHLVRAYHETYGLPVSLTNCSNNYGPYQFPEKLIPLMIINALEGKLLPVYGDGLQIRDWLYVDDHCEAIWRVITEGKVGETYNIGGNNQPTNLEIIETICKILDGKFPNNEKYAGLIQHVKDRPGHDRRYAMDISKIKNNLGWQPLETLESGLVKTIDWYLDNSEWVARITNKADFTSLVKRNYKNR